MTENEIRALMPIDAKPALDHEFYRDLVNHWSMWGSDSIVKKRGRHWVTDFRGHGHPTIFKTKREAVAMGDAWVLSISHESLHKPPA